MQKYHLFYASNIETTPRWIFKMLCIYCSIEYYDNDSLNKDAYKMEYFFIYPETIFLSDSTL